MMSRKRALKQTNQMPKGQLLPFVQSGTLWVEKSRNEKKRLADKQRSIIYTWNDIFSASPLHSNGREEWIQNSWNVGPGSPKDLLCSYLHKKYSQMWMILQDKCRLRDQKSRKCSVFTVRTGIGFGTRQLMGQKPQGSQQFPLWHKHQMQLR